jgi:hypothetical protein
MKNKMNNKRMIGCDFLDGRNRWLEYQKSLPPLSPLAGLPMFRQTVCNPRVAAFRGLFSGVSNSSSTSTVLRSPARPTSA